VTFAVNKREGRLKTHVSYTWSRQEGTMNALSNDYGDIPARDVFTYGPLNDDHRHEVKLSSQWQATRWLTIGARYDYISGLPYNRLFPTLAGSTLTFGQQYKAKTGVNPGTNINDPNDDRELRMPDRQDVNVQVRLNMMPLIGQQLDFYVDVLNALSLHTPTAYGTEDGRNFGVETAWVQPFRVRLGFNYRY
jgi:hypothetical protein